MQHVDTAEYLLDKLAEHRSAQPQSLDVARRRNEQPGLHGRTDGDLVVVGALGQPFLVQRRGLRRQYEHAEAHGEAGIGHRDLHEFRAQALKNLAGFRHGGRDIVIDIFVVVVRGNAQAKPLEAVLKSTLVIGDGLAAGLGIARVVARPRQTSSAPRRAPSWPSDPRYRSTRNAA